MQALQLQGVTKLYPNNKGIHSIDLAVPSGQIFGFLGPNGAGKTTTIRTIMDFMRPQSGSISIFGLDAQRDSVAAKADIGYVPADRQLYMHWNGQQHLNLYRSLRPKSSLDAVKELGIDLKTPVKHLSTGNRQKLSVALALVGQPKLLIMDEPTAGLDPIFQQTIYDLLRSYKQAGGTVFLSSHNLAEVEKICDHVGIIKEGRMVADTSMDDLRDMSMHIVTVVSKEPLGKLSKNTVISHRSGNHVTIKVTGDLNPLLALLAKHTIADLEITHASLEDIFLEYYT